MRLSQRHLAFAAPDDSVYHLGPRERLDDDGPLTLCGLFLSPMVLLSDSAAATRRRCAVCEDLSG